MYVMNGHSVSVGGIILAAVSDHKTKTFTITQSGEPHNGSAKHVATARALLVKRMTRFLGPEWKEAKP